MEERVLLKCQNRNSKLWNVIVFFMVCLLAFWVYRVGMVAWNHTEDYDLITSVNGYWLREKYSSRLDMWFDEVKLYIPSLIIEGVIPFVASIWVNLWISNTELTITNRRIYGKKAYGKRFEVPLCDVSFVNNTWPAGISLNCAAGQIKVPYIQNREHAFGLIHELLLERQNELSAPKQEIVSNVPDEIKKYSELLSAGVITQDEFEAKKKQLLNM